MAKKSASKLHKMIPPGIRTIIMDRPVISFTESPDEYDDLLLCLAELFKPTDALYWFDVKQYCTLLWEAHRLDRITPAIIETSWVVKDECNKQMMLINQIKALAAAHPDKFTKKQLRQEINKVLVPMRVIEAKAVVERIDVLQVVDRLKASNHVQQRFMREVLAERQTIELLPVKANDNEKQAAKLVARNRGEDEEAVVADEADPDEGRAAAEAPGVDSEAEPDGVAQEEGSDNPDEEAA